MVCLALADGEVAKEDGWLACCCWASCLQERIIMTIRQLNKTPIMQIMKRTLQEKLALIPATPESPATLEGSLHPSQAISDGM